MDPLDDLLARMPVRNARFTRLDASAPWGFASRGEPAIQFVLVVRGSAILTSASRPEPMPLCGGDVFIMVNEEPYRLYDHESSLTIDCIEVEKLRVGDRIEVGGGGAVTTFISGYFELDAAEAMPLLDALPPLICLKHDQGRSLAFHSVLELLAMETQATALGSQAVVNRLFELLFVHAIRAHAAQPGAPSKGWLAAMTDRQLARAVEAMHGDLAGEWTVESLARVAGMSRSAFALRFRSLVGQTPFEYLTHWRMYKASSLVKHSDMPLSEVSRHVGYESVAAFNRVFRRAAGTTPGSMRRATALRRV